LSSFVAIASSNPRDRFWRPGRQRGSAKVPDAKLISFGIGQDRYPDAR
jgi:hypothetical protein